MTEIRQLKVKDIQGVRELEIDCIKEYFAATIENKWEDLPQEWKDNLGASSRNHFKTYLESGVSFVALE
jgi:aminoglycoside 6'-N-acetyltransferase I